MVLRGKIRSVSAFVAVLLVCAAALGQSKAVDPALLAKAKAGDAESQYELGTAYLVLYGKSKEATVAYWDRKAAEQGYARAQADLGVMYELGDGVPQDFVQAAVWYRKAAEQGDPFAEWNLGKAYRFGRGVPEDFAQAAIWFRKAANQGIANAQYELALQLMNGWGVPQGTREAMELFQKAADAGDADSQYMLGQLLEDGGMGHIVHDSEGTTKVAPPSGERAIPKNITLAAQWYRKAAEQQNEMAQSALGRLYEDGLGVPQDYAESYFWYSLATAYAGSANGGQSASINAESRDRVAEHLTRTELTGVQENTRKWFEAHPPQSQQ